MNTKTSQRSSGLGHANDAMPSYLLRYETEVDRWHESAVAVRSKG